MLITIYILFYIIEDSLHGERGDDTKIAYSLQIIYDNDRLIIIKIYKF